MKLFFLVVILPLLCRASTTEDYISEDRTKEIVYTTDESRLVSLYPVHRHTSTSEPEETTGRPRRHCFPIVTSPLHLEATYGSAASFNCSCWLDSIDYRECPEWRGIYNTPHTYSLVVRPNVCTVTLTIPKVNFETPTELTCADVMSTRKTQSHIHYMQSNIGKRCDHDEDCLLPFKCVENGPQNKTCSCPEIYPIYTPSNCLPVSRLLNPCTISAQCKASDRNSYCMPSGVNNTGELYCLCGPGYELGNDGRCVCEDCGLNYVYRLSKRYQIVFYCLLSISLLLILLGLLRICMVSRLRGNQRPGVIVPIRPEDSGPLTDVKPVKEKF